MMKTLSFAAAAVLLVAPAMAGSDDDEHNPTARMQQAAAVLKSAVNAPDKGIPRDLLEKAECVGVFPELKKGAFVVGGEFGRGVFTCRQADGSMGAPAFFKMGGGSVGWQFGGEEADVVLLIMNKSGLDHLLEDKFTIGGEASAVAGPVGRTASAATDAQLHAQILSWSRSRGAFVGVSVEGDFLKPDTKTNQNLYGKALSSREILVGGATAVPKTAENFVSTTNQYSKRSS